MSQRDEPVAFGKYQLVERLGRGGMAEVWKARMVGPAGFERTLVIKRILPQLVEDPDFIAMFVSEARLSARLNHANIVTVFELAKVGAEYYLAMEYVRGHDLISVLRANAPRGMLSPGFAAYVLREVCRALGYAHAITDDDGVPLRIIHRDVSPSNVMIGFDGAVKLLDFGIAKALSETDDSKTLTGTLKGKLGYMSPEQLEGREIDHRADLFSIGVLLWELVTGRRLFKGVTDVQTIAQVREAPVAPPSTVNRETPPELDQICLKALARDPAQRYQSGEELAAALDRVAHQFDWGAERMVTLMRSLFPDEVSHTKTRVPRPLAARTEDDEYIEYLPARRPRRVAAWLFAGGAALATAGGLTWWRLQANAPAPALAPTGAAGPIVVQPLPPDEVKRTAGAMVIVDSQPAGAEIFGDGAAAPLGRTPMAVAIAPGAGARGLTLKLDGYAAARRAVTAQDGPRVVVALAPLDGEPARGRHGALKSAAAQKSAVAAKNAALPKNSDAPQAAAPQNAALQNNSDADKNAAPPKKSDEPKPAETQPKPKPRENLIKGDFVDPFGEGK